ncbi:MAG: HelD family protein [Nocardioidaceae bacterium]
MPDTSDADLDQERAHLRRSRARLAQMRSAVAGLKAHGGNPVSTEYLKGALFARMRALEDDPDVPLFFGRLDFDCERLYVGRRHVTDTAGDPMVIDWRARVARAFSRASRTDPMGVRSRRRFGFARGTLTAYEDEDLSTPGRDVAGQDGVTSQILIAEIERPRAGPMRDIVATISPDQDDIVRADLSASLCVQGAPGTGKTAVGLHRAAFLLYAFRDQLSRQGVLVVGPNTSFLRYIADVLPALGEVDASQSTVEQLTAHVPVRRTELARVAAIKSNARMADVVTAACWAHLAPQSEALVVPRGTRRWRIAAYEASDIVDGLRGRQVRYGTGRTMFAQRLAHEILVKMEVAGESPDDRVQETIARSRPVRAYVDAWWPRLDAAKVVYRLLTDAEFLASVSTGVLTDEERRGLALRPRPRSLRNAGWTIHDLALIDEAADLIARTPSVGHVVLDEAQDLSPMMLRAVARRCETGSMTVLGDLAQATTPWASRSWGSALRHLGKTDAHIEELTQGFRVPQEILAYATRLLPRIAPDLEPPTSVRTSAGAMSVRRGALADTVEAAAHELGQLPGTLGIIVADRQVGVVTETLVAAGVRHDILGADGALADDVTLVPAALAKGLEFDHVIVVEPAAIVAGEPDEMTGLRRLYVCLTRAVTSLVVLHETDLPEPLG